MAAASSVTDRAGEDNYAYWFWFAGVEHKLQTLMLAEARAIQRATGLKIPDFDTALRSGDAEAVTALIWVAQKRHDPALRFEDVDGDLGTFEPGRADREDEASSSDDEAEPEPGKEEAGSSGSAAGGSTRAGSRRSSSPTRASSGGSSASAGSTRTG